MTISRRNFVQLIGTAALSSRAVGSSFPDLAGSTTEAQFIYAGSTAGVIDVFASRHGRVERTQQIITNAPAAMRVAYNGRALYVVNEIASYRGLPRGTVESFRIADDGTLSLQDRQELSLSATMPQHLAMAPDGRSMVVSSRGGGIINVLPITEDNAVGRPVSIFKATGDTKGREAHLAGVSFDATGRILCADRGTGCVSVLTAAEDGLLTHSRTMTSSDDSPAEIAFHQQTNSLFVSHRNSLEHYAYDHRTGEIGELRQRFAGVEMADSAGALTIHPSGLLYACDGRSGIAAWRIRDDGTLSFAGRYAEELGAVSAIHIAHDGRAMVAMSRTSGLIARAVVDVQSGLFGATEVVARVTSPRSLAVTFRQA